MVKYILYALGEVILVVIGILIALMIDTKNEEAIAEAKAKQLLSEVKKELTVNIGNLRVLYKATKQRTRHIIGSRMKSDTTTIDTMEDRSLSKLGLTGDLSLRVRQAHYENFLRNSSTLPQRFHVVLSGLDGLVGYKVRIEKAKNDYQNVKQVHVEYMLNTYPWYSAPDTSEYKKQKIAEFKLNDFRYKGMVHRVDEVLLDYTFGLWALEKQSVAVFRKVSDLLGIPKDSVEVELNEIQSIGIAF